MREISMETKVREILDSKTVLSVCNSVSGDMFSSPMLASVGTMSLSRVAGLLGEGGARMMQGIIEKANELLRTLPNETVAPEEAKDEVANSVGLSERTADEREKNKRTYRAIEPGKVWYDTDGNRIQAHGASVYFEDGVYYWIGENKDHTTKEGSIWTWGVKLYSSKDLYNWKDEGYLVEPELKDKTSVFYPVRRLDRPHMLYNAKTKKYVLWLKYCDEAHFTVLTADSFMGKYTVVREVYRPFDTKCGDFDLAKDEKTGQGYLWWDVNHTDVWGVKLSDDYTEVQGEYSVIYKEMRPPFAREAIAHMERGGKHYLFSSGMTGYVPNPSEVAVSDDWLTGYTVQGDPHIGDDSRSSFNSQISHIFKVDGQDRYIAIADRWVPEFVMTGEKYDLMVRAIQARYDPKIEVTAEEKRYLMGMPMMGTANTSIANYVWLPIEFEGDTAKIRWRDQWEVSKTRG